ncbi:hypothetical protein CLU79DRAFT_64007 [Phycomyces nitens]|nr:hypothetical protein CLU79DRAFT_64007 [Phycomyces nitens]
MIHILLSFFLGAGGSVLAKYYLKGGLPKADSRCLVEISLFQLILLLFGANITPSFFCTPLVYKIPLNKARNTLKSIPAPIRNALV